MDYKKSKATHNTPPNPQTATDSRCDFNHAIARFDATLSRLAGNSRDIRSSVCDDCDSDCIVSPSNTPTFPYRQRFIRASTTPAVAKKIKPTVQYRRPKSKTFCSAIPNNPHNSTTTNACSFGARRYTLPQRINAAANNAINQMPNTTPYSTIHSKYSFSAWRNRFENQKL